MATQGTYYLDSPSLSSATIIYSDSELTTVAPDGFYSDGAISREQASGVLLPQVTCPSCGDTEVYFNTLVEDIVTMGINNYVGQTFDISIAYDMYALCDNEGTSGSDPNSATTTLYVSKDNGATYTTVASITASVSGSNFPTPQFDNVSIIDTYTITGVTDVSQVKIYGTTDCDTGLNGKDGSVTVALQLTIPATTIICNDIYTKTCTASTLTCTP